MRIGATLAIIGTIGIALSGTAMPTGSRHALMTAICGDPTRLIRIPFERDDSPTDDCPSACHAICARRAHGESDE